MQHVDLHTWQRGDILVKADRMSMAHGLELRVPFLDPEVFAVASRLPRHAKLAGGTTKHALRQALRHVVPAEVVHRPKLGFPVPVSAWLRDELCDWADEVTTGFDADHLLDLRAVRGCSTSTGAAAPTTDGGCGRSWCSYSGTPRCCRPRPDEWYAWHGRP